MCAARLWVPCRFNPQQRRGVRDYAALPHHHHCRHIAYRVPLAAGALTELALNSIFLACVAEKIQNKTRSCQSMRNNLFDAEVFMISSNGQYALITGATSGIGYELAKIFAEHKYNLVIVARTEADLHRTATELSSGYGVSVVPIKKDLFRREAPFELYQEVSAQGYQIDVLVNDAAQGLYGKFIDTDIHRELDMLQLNIGAYLVLTKLFLREMVERGSGKILNVASIASKLPGPYQSVYHGTKAFIHSFTESIRAELQDTGVTVTSLLPGVTDTDFFNKADMEDSKILDQKMADPAKVARDGFDALMSGDDMVVSGMKNKAQIAASNVTPDSVLAKTMLKQQAPRSQQ